MAAIAVIVVVGLIGGGLAAIRNASAMIAFLSGEKTTLPATTSEMISLRGMPLLRCDAYAFVPFDGGVTSRLTQVNFEAIAAADDTRRSHRIWVYTDRAMPGASVEAFFKEKRKSLHQSYSPSIEYEIYEVDESGRVVGMNKVTATHMLLLAEREAE